MTTLNKQDYANISAFTYNNEKNIRIDLKKPIKVPADDPNGKYYFIHAVKIDKNSDMQGFLLELAGKDKSHTGEFVTAFRGSESFRDWKGNFGFLGVLAGKGEHPQISAVIKFAEEAQTLAKRIANQNHTPYSMVNTGHSLGGMGAQVATTVNGAPAVTFNPLPITLSRSWDAAIKRHADKIENHVTALDPASSLVTNLPGRTFRYTNANEIRALQENGYHTPERKDDYLAGIFLKSVASHSINNFTGSSSLLLSARSQELAKQHQTEINRFRAEIAEFGAASDGERKQIYGREMAKIREHAGKYANEKFNNGIDSFNHTIDNGVNYIKNINLKDMFSESETQPSPLPFQGNKELFAKLSTNNLGSDAAKPDADIKNGVNPNMQTDTVQLAANNPNKPVANPDSEQKANDSAASPSPSDDFGMA